MVPPRRPTRHDGRTGASAHDPALLDRVRAAVEPLLRAAVEAAVIAALAAPPAPPPPRRPRHGARPGDLVAEVDPVTRAAARAHLLRHAGGRR